MKKLMVMNECYQVTWPIWINWTCATLIPLALAKLFVSRNRPKLLVEFLNSNNPVKSYEFMLPCQWPLWFRLTCATLRPVVIANLFVSLNRPKLSVEFFKSNTAVKSYKFMLPCQWPLWFRLTCAALRLLVETVN